MTGREIILDIKAALEGDEQIRTWCQANFGADLSVAVGWARDGVPADDWAYPCCNLALWKLSISESERLAALELDMEAAVYPAQATRDEGALLADDLLCLCRDAIARAQVGTEISAETTGGLTEESPRYAARGTITINCLRSHRAGLGR